MRMRMLLPTVVVLAAVFGVTGCGGGSSADSGGGGSTTGGILRVGTVNTIDSLNPFTAIESQSYNAFVMEYPQLVQYGPGPKLEGDWATSWSHSADGKTWTFKLKPGGKWSDGKPLTAADAAWTGNTIIKYQASATAALAGALTHVTSMDAPNATTLNVHYDAAVANVLPQLEQFWVLPEHIWGSLTGNSGKDLKSYQPQDHLPTVAGGAYTITKYDAKGTTVFKPNPDFYGPKSNAEAVAMTYYTNATTMIADFTSGNLDFVDQVPFNAVSSRQGRQSLHRIQRSVLGGDQHHLQHQPGQAQEPRAAQPQGERGSRVRHRPPADRGHRVRGLRHSRGRTTSRASRQCGSIHRSSRCRSTSTRPTRFWTRWGMRRTRTESGRCRRPPASTPSPPTRCPTT